jgi:hypothetical protein
LSLVTRFDSRHGSSCKRSASHVGLPLHLLDPHDSHVMKYRRFSLPSRVSGDLQILQVTYSTTRNQHLLPLRSRHLPIYFLNTFSICFWVYLPFMTNLCAPSTDPWVPNSEYKNWMTCSGCRCIRRQISVKLAKTVFFVPSRATWGGTIVYLRFSPASSGLCAWRSEKNRDNSYYV